MGECPKKRTGIHPTTSIQTLFLSTINMSRIIMIYIFFVICCVCLTPSTLWVYENDVLKNPLYLYVAIYQRKKTMWGTGSLVVFVGTWTMEGSNLVSAVPRGIGLFLWLKHEVCLVLVSTMYQAFRISESDLLTYSRTRRDCATILQA